MCCVLLALGTLQASRCWQEYAAVASPLMAWIDAKQAETDELVVPEGIEELKVG